MHLQLQISIKRQVRMYMYNNHLFMLSRCIQLWNGRKGVHWLCMRSDLLNKGEKFKTHGFFVF